jgi:flagellar basal body rod protein FlgC
VQVEAFKASKLAIERMREIQRSWRVQVEKVRDPKNPNANGHGYVWVISVTVHNNAETLYLCTDGCLR